MSRFLIVRLGSLGDVIHGIPVAAALRRHAPDARIDWLVDPKYVDVLNLVPAIDNRIAVDPRGSRGALWHTMRELRRTKYDAALDLQGLIKSAVLARSAGASQTVGFSRAHLREAIAELLYTRRVDPRAARHVIDKNFALIEPLGVREPRVEFPLRVEPTGVSEQVAARFVDGYALINPGAAWPNKRWPPERFGAVAAALRDHLGIRSLVLWGPGEQSIASAVVEASQNAAELSPPTTVIDLFAVARGARLMLSGDTGPLHIAAAVGTPTVSLFGPTYPERNGPWAADDIALSRAQTCSCQYERRCRRATPCIDEISTAEAIAAVERRMVRHG